MIPGPYSILQTTYEGDSDAMSYMTLTFGYDTAEQAYSALGKVATDAGVPAEECIVMRIIEREEAADFNK